MAEVINNAAETPAAKTKILKVGDTVKLVTARRERIDATVDKQNKDGTINLTATYLGKELVITSSPYDPTASTPDSWH